MAENRKPKPPPDDPEQSERFIRTAKDAEVKDDNAFARALNKIIPKKNRKRRHP